jgi:NAD(P)H dehydrogenase (quinone)
MIPDNWELPVLVSGASGQLGRLVVSHLLDTFKVPADQIIATTRTPEKIADFTRRGVVVREADFERPETLVKAFTGAKRALLISIWPDEEYPGQEGRRQRLQAGAVNAVREAGVPHVLITSAPNAEPGNPAHWHAAHYQTELAVINSGLKWTILRNWDWPDSRWHRYWRKALETGVFRTAAGKSGSSFVAREDAAAAAAGALLSETSICRRFDITGPEVMTAEDIFSTLEKLTGKKVKIEYVTPEEWERTYLAEGGDPFNLLIMPAHMRSELGGFFGGLSNAVEELSGRRPMTMLEYLPRIMNSPDNSPTRIKKGT